MLERKDFLFLFLFASFFIFLSWFLNPYFFQNHFDEGLISDYLRSQDIEDKEDRIRVFLQGVFLGFLFASKFWSISFLYFAFLVFYRIWFLKDKSFVKSLPILLFVSFLVFSSFYIKSFLSGTSLFDFLFLQAKTVKFMLTHNSTNNFGNLFLLFISGHYISWWEGGGLVKSQSWSLFWPVSFLASIFLAFRFAKDKKVWFVFVFPIFYFLVNLTNTAFTRYLLFVLPFLYISLSYGLIFLIKSKVKIKS